MKRILMATVLASSGACGTGAAGKSGNGGGNEVGVVAAGGRSSDPTGEWTLVALAGDSRQGATIDPPIDLTFTADSGFAGSAGCNRYFGHHSLVPPDSVAMGPTGSTMMMCAPEVMEREHSFLAALDSVTTYRTVGDTLVMFGGAPGNLLRFVRRASARGR